MTILLATGIYPPDIGGPATYAEKLSVELRRLGHTVRVVTYGASDLLDHDRSLIVVQRRGFFLLRWLRYARALRRHGRDADVVIALSSVSVGVPLLLSRLRRPKRVLRLGGEFFWERYTDAGGMLSLDAWHRRSYGLWHLVHRLVMPSLLRSFDAIVYSTAMQQAIHRTYCSALSPTTVIENAMPPGTPLLHRLHTPPRLLVMSRLVGFKNLLSLLDALALLSEDVRCTIVGSGPMEAVLRAQISEHRLTDRVTIQRSLCGEEKIAAFASHDFLVIPSITDISPNTALEARASGLPVLLTMETGLSPRLTQGMVTLDLRSPQAIARAVREGISRYDALAADAASPPLRRDWSALAAEWQECLRSLIA